MRSRRLICLDHVGRHADGARLVGQGARDRLADPPGGVGRELVAPAVVELLDRADEAQVALLDEVEQRQPAAHVALGDRDHEAQVGLGELALGLHVAALDALGQRDFLYGREQRHLADLLEVHAHGIVTCRLDRQVEHRSDLFAGVLHHVDHGRSVALEELDALIGEHHEERLELLGGGLDIA